MAAPGVTVASGPPPARRSFVRPTSTPATVAETDLACYEAHRRRASQDFMILFAGPAGSGKTSLINQTLLEPNGQHASYPVEMTVEDSYDTLINGTRVHIVDTGGQHHYRSLVLEKMGRADMVVFVFDASDAEASLEELEDFAGMLVYCREVLPPVVVVANKCDRVAGDWRQSMSQAQLDSLDNVSVNHFEAFVVGTQCDVSPDGYRIRSSLSQRSTTRLRDTLASAMTVLSSRSIGSSQSDLGSVSSICASPGPHVYGGSRSCNTSPRHPFSASSGSMPSSPRPQLSPRAYSASHVAIPPPTVPVMSAHTPGRHARNANAAAAGAAHVVRPQPIHRHALGPLDDDDDHIRTGKCLVQ